MIDSISELRAAEAEILERLRSVPNGPMLFLVDPIRALRDAGFELKDPALRELRETIPVIEGSLAAYTAIKESEDLEQTDVELRGLFDWAGFE